LFELIVNYEGVRNVKMDVEEIILLYVRHEKKLNKKNKKKSWMLPFIGDRFESGPLYNLYGDLRKYFCKL
jgi:hypothetical protein